MDTVYRRFKRQKSATLCMIVKDRRRAIAGTFANSFFSFMAMRLVIGCTKTNLASSVLQRKRTTSSWGDREMRKRSLRRFASTSTMGYCHRSRWYSYTNYDNDRSIPLSSSFCSSFLSFISLYLPFSPLRASSRTLVRPLLPLCIRAQLAPSSSHALDETYL